MKGRAREPDSTVTPAMTGRMPTPVEPLSDSAVPRVERCFAAPFPGIGYRGCHPPEPRSTTHGPLFGAPAPPCYGRRRRVPDDAPAPPRRNRP